MVKTAITRPRFYRSINLWLLASLVLSLLILPTLEKQLLGRVLLVVGLTITGILGGIVVPKRPRTVIFLVLVFWIPMIWISIFVESKPLYIAHCLLASLFLGTVGGTLIFLIVRSRSITVDSIFGAINGYLIFGLAWAFAYAAIHTLLPEAIFFGSHQAKEALGDRHFANISEFIYFSFVTMTTLGFGDITPRGPVTRAVTWMQAVVGQFYVAVLVAWLVSSLPGPETVDQQRTTSAEHEA